jgi:L-iditol 2-dehydrogenase
MLAAVYRGPMAIGVEEVPVPRPSLGEVLVRVERCGVCHTDLKKIAMGLYAPPLVFGHETSGVIVELGSGVSDW